MRNLLARIEFTLQQFRILVRIPYRRLVPRANVQKRVVRNESPQVFQKYKRASNSEGYWTVGTCDLRC